MSSKSNTPAWHYVSECAAGEIAHVRYLMVYGLWTPERAAACAGAHDRTQVAQLLASVS